MPNPMPVRFPQYARMRIRPNATPKGKSFDVTFSCILAIRIDKETITMGTITPTAIAIAKEAIPSRE
jgi:hypothetical protein